MPIFHKYKWEISKHPNTENILVTYDPSFPSGIFYQKSYIDYNSTRIRHYILCNGDFFDYHMSEFKKPFINIPNIPRIDIDAPINVSSMIENY